MKLRHIGIVVQDLEESVKFWTVEMGMSIQVSQIERGHFIDTLLGQSDIKVQTVKLDGLGNCMIELLKFESQSGEPSWSGDIFSTGLTHIAITISDLKEFLNNLETVSLEIFNEPAVSPDGRALVVYAKGPEGLLIEFVEELEMY